MYIAYKIFECLWHATKDKLISRCQSRRCHLATKVADDSRVYKRRPTLHRVLRDASWCISSPISFARASVRELFATRADYCHLLVFDEQYCRREHCRWDRLSLRSFLGNSVTFLVRTDIWGSLTCLPMPEGMNIRTKRFRA